MGQNQSAPGGGAPGEQKKDQVRYFGLGGLLYLVAMVRIGTTEQLGGVVGTILLSQEKKKKYEPPAPPPRVGKKQKKRDTAASLGAKLPTVTPTAKCKLRLLKLERIKDYLLMEEEFVQNQEQLKPQEERNEEDRSKVRLGGAVGGPRRASQGSVRDKATGDQNV